MAVFREEIFDCDIPTVMGDSIRIAKKRAIDTLILEELVWEKRDKTKIRVKNMDDDHIRNCINLIERSHLKHHEDSKRMVNLFKLELEIRN
jgi:hypothetical protein